MAAWAGDFGCVEIAGRARDDEWPAGGALSSGLLNVVIRHPAESGIFGCIAIAGQARDAE